MFSELFVPPFLKLRETPLQLTTACFEEKCFVLHFLAKSQRARCHFCSAHDWLMELLQSQGSHLLFVTVQRTTCLLESIKHPFFPPGFVVLFNLSFVFHPPLLPRTDRMPFDKERGCAVTSQLRSLTCAVRPAEQSAARERGGPEPGCSHAPESRGSTTRGAWAGSQENPGDPPCPR